MTKTHSTMVFMGALAALAGCGGPQPVENAAALPAAAHEKGGTTFDFAACSARRFAGAFDPAKNVVKEPVSAHTSNHWSKVFALPHTNSAIWRFSARYRLAHPVKAGGANLRLSPGTLEGPRQRFRALKDFKPGRAVNLLECGGAWGEMSATITAPAGATHLFANVWHLPNTGVDFEIKDVSIVDETPQEPIVFKEMPMGNLDGVFAVGQGQAGEYEYYWRTTRANKINLNDLRFTVELPAGFAFLGCTYAKTNTIQCTAHADGSSTATFHGGYVGGTLGPAFNHGNGVGIVVKATGAVGTRGTARLRVACAAKKGPRFEVAAPALTLATVPAVKTSAWPKRYANGAMFARLFANLDDAAFEALSRTLVDGGVTWMVGSSSQPRYALWRKMGVKYITPTAWQCNNGFDVGKAWEKPASDKFVTCKLDPNDSHAAYVKNGTCPVTVYEESDFFRTNTVPFIQDFVKGTDGLWSNWEPWMFNGKGCYCARCCRKFAEYVKKPYEEIAKTWPDCVRRGGAYTNAIQKFRSREHARLVHTIDKYVRAATGGEKSLGFIPAIAWIEMSGWWRPRNYAAEVQAIDYAGGLKWMNPWGPYAAWESNYPYVYAKRKPLCHFFAAKDVRETVDADYPARAHASSVQPALGRPKLMALPQGYQCGHWLSQPEHIAMALDSYFFNGFESTVEYFFPRGYDARYWAGFADATARAARYEDFVIDGRRVDKTARAVACAGLYAANVKHLSGYLPEYNDLSPLQTVAYEKDGVRIVAVFNFWQKGEAFFDLKLADLPKGCYTIVSEKGVLRAKTARDVVWCGRELAEKGVRLSAGASRCTVFEIRPAAQKIAPKAILTDEALSRTLEERRGALEKAAAEDAAYEKANGELVYDSMPVI